MEEPTERIFARDSRPSPLAHFASRGKTCTFRQENFVGAPADPLQSVTAISDMHLFFSLGPNNLLFSLGPLCK